MRTVVIVGGGRRVGKTTLAFALEKLLQGAEVVKLGEHPMRGDKPGILFPLNTPYSKLQKKVPDCPFLILESGSILDDPSLTPDLVIYLPTEDGRVDKPGSERRRAKADLVRGETDTGKSPSIIAHKLGIELALAQEVLLAIENRPLASIR